MSTLAVSDLSWGPGRGPDILSGITLAVPDGGIVGIVGPNGAGKSSLLRCIYRVNKPRRGQVLVGGEDVWALPPRTAAQRIAAVVQDAPGEPGLSVAEVVGLGRLPHLERFERPGARDRDAVNAALAAVELDTLGHRTMGTLSGGERQRVAIARVLAQDPAVIVLDEPSNHLDIRHQLELMDLLRRLGRTILVTLHDLALAARSCDRLAILQNGRLVAEGLPREVMTPRRLRDSFGVVAEVSTRDGGDLDLSFRLPRSQP